MSASTGASSAQCRTREALQKEASETLQRMIDLTKSQIKALAENDQQMLLSLDKQLEMTFGAKERSFGALREHTKEHGC